MPTYEFRCPKGHDFERFYRTISGAPAEVHCPECGELAVRQLSGGAGLVFKGSGFYITDYGKDGKKDQRQAPAKSVSGSGEKSESATAKSSDTSGTGSADSKSPAASTDSKSSAGSSESKTSGSSPAAPAPKSTDTK